MDVVRRHTQEDCENVFQTLPKTIVALLPTVEARKAEITSVEKKTFKYGSTDRHQLDVYYPPAGTVSGPAPILFWAYGGGFVSGERTIPGSGDLVYGTVGAFFARQGFLTVIPDYRLAPAAKYPAQSEDLRDAMLWVSENAALVATPGVQPDTGSLVVMGHSAGAINVLTLFLHKTLVEGTPLLGRVKGIVLHGTVFHVRGPEMIPPPVLEAYFGAAQGRDALFPCGQLAAASDETLKNLPAVLIVEAEKEPSLVKISSEEFTKELEGRLATIGGGKGGWKEVKKITAQGHDHISPNWVVGSADGGEWGHDVSAWLKDALKST